MSGRVGNGSGPHLVTIDGRRVKCSDLDARVVLALIDRLSHQPWPHRPSEPPLTPRWVMWPEVARLYPLLPAKVVWAKCCSLIRRGWITGCHCGCRGDFELTALGREQLTGDPS